MKIIRFVAPVSLTLSLMGCGTLYKPPKTPEAASFTINNNTQYSLFVNSFKESADCSGGEIRLTENIYGIVDGQDKITVKVEPNKPFSFELETIESLGNINYHCRLISTFIPKPYQNYHASYIRDRKGCFVKLNRVTKDGNIPERTFKKRKMKVTLVSSQSRCE